MLIYNQDIYKIIIIAIEYQKNHCIVVCYFLHRHQIVASLNKIIICVTLDFSIIMPTHGLLINITIDTFSVYSTMIYVIFLIKYIFWTITKDFFYFLKEECWKDQSFEYKICGLLRTRSTIALASIAQPHEKVTPEPPCP